MTSFEEIFNQLPKPSAEDEYVFSAEQIPNFPNHRIAKNSKGKPSFLFSIGSEDNSFEIPKQKLYNLAIVHDLECQINDSSENFTGRFSVLSYVGEDAELATYFLKIGEVLIPTLGSESNKLVIVNIIKKFIELFKEVGKHPKKTIQGLWAELLVISLVANTEEYIQAWHNNPEDRFDFSFQNLQVEIKSNASRSREHHFSLEQLISIGNTETFIVSVFVEALSNGKSIEDLVHEISFKLQGSIELIEKLNMTVFTTLNGNIKGISEFKFNHQLAIENLKAYNSKNIPVIEDIPKHISKVSFQCDLENIEASALSDINLEN